MSSFVIKFPIHVIKAQLLAIRLAILELTKDNAEDSIFDEDAIIIFSKLKKTNFFLFVQAFIIFPVKIFINFK